MKIPRWNREIWLINPHRTIQIIVPRIGSISYKINKKNLKGEEADFVVIDEEITLYDATYDTIVEGKTKDLI